MRVALLQDHLRSGGTERQTLAIAQGLAEAGIDARVIVFRAGGALDEEARSDGARAPIFLSRGPLANDWLAPGLRRTLRREAPDVIIAMGRMANCHAGLLRSIARPRAAIVATCRTGRSLPFLHRLALRRADHVVANSQEALRRVAPLAGLDSGLSQRSSVIYNGCLRDFDAYAPSFAPPETAPRLHLCSVSMFRPQKQQIRLLRLCAALPADIEWKLTLAGDGPSLPACKAEAKRLGLQRRVEFPGLLKDPRSLYAAADLALHVSDAESLPNFLVEAQTAGLPVIAYDVGGVAETFIHETSGLLIRHGDEIAFRAALERLARSPAMRHRMSAAARERARSLFSLAAQSAAYAALVRRLGASRR